MLGMMAPRRPPKHPEEWMDANDNYTCSFLSSGSSNRWGYNNTPPKPCSLQLTRLDVSVLPKPVLVDAQVPRHHFPASIPHPVDEEAPGRAERPNEEVGVRSHQEVHERVVRTCLSAKTRLVARHQHASDLARHVGVVELPSRV